MCTGRGGRTGNPEPFDVSPSQRYIRMAMCTTVSVNLTITTSVVEQIALDA